MKSLIIDKLLLRREKFLLEVEHLEVDSGEILGVMGKSGSGKTTFLHAVAGLVSIQEGKLIVRDQEITQLPPEKRKTAIVFQKPWLFEHQTVLENVYFGLKIQGFSKKDCVDQAKDWLSKMEITHLENKRIWEVSGGEAQRVALARALAVRFPLVLLDEPFSALDAPLRRGLRELVRKLIKESGSSAILVSHDWRDVEEVASRVLVLSDGKVAALDKVSEMREHPNREVQAIFGE